MEEDGEEVIPPTTPADVEAPDGDKEVTPPKAAEGTPTWRKRLPPRLPQLRRVIKRG